jgi:SagB-type dehydrogenase family enzyme
MSVLKERRSTRAFSSRPLEPQTLSNLLWAAFGVNRPENGHRTAPSARDFREIDVYAASSEGVYRYDPEAHALERSRIGDIRAATGVQDFVASAPMNLVYVADFARVEAGSQAEKEFFAAADAGFIAQNVYLYCASAGLATVVRGLIDRRALAKQMALRPQQRIILAQSVGHPAD